MKEASAAAGFLAEEVAKLRRMSYGELSKFLGAPEVNVRVGPTGTRFNLVVEAFWDDREGEDLRVMCTIDDGGLSWFIPKCSDFIMSPDGSFVGE